MRELRTLLIAGIALFPAGLCFAEDASSKTVPLGVFQSFDWTQQLRLAATALVNPEVASNSMVVYSSDITPILKKQESAELVKKIESGEVTVAKQTAEGFYRTLSPSEGATFINEGKTSGKLVSFGPKYPDIASDKLIGWSVSAPTSPPTF
jgi:hypothetical protein